MQFWVLIIGVVIPIWVGLSVFIWRIFISKNQDATRDLSRDSALRQEMALLSRQAREEQAGSLKQLNDSLLQSISHLSLLQKNQLDGFAKGLEGLRQTVEQRLGFLQQENAKKLDEMRQTVDEKLHATLEKRLGESFAQVSERLEKVHQGLGEMQVLASGVGDLKRVLTNVKVRGIWGEVQLGNLLEQVLTLDQYAQNVRTKPGSLDHVEYAIKLPGQDPNGEIPLWLPIDSKYPQDVYQQLTDAQESAQVEAVDAAAKQLEQRIKLDAKTISEKYVSPPHTTDFGILFLPVEGLYAEVLRRPGLIEFLQTEYRVMIAGPTTLAALLNSLRMGFRTLQIEKRSSEVWSILGGVKQEFGKFGDLLDKTQKKLHEAGNVIEDASRRSRAIERKLRDVEAPAGLAEPITEGIFLG